MQECLGFPVGLYNQSNRESLAYTAISRKVVKNVHKRIPKGIMGSFEFTVLQKKLKDWHKRPWTYVCEC